MLQAVVKRTAFFFLHERGGGTELAPKRVALIVCTDAMHEVCLAHLDRLKNRYALLNIIVRVITSTNKLHPSQSSSGVPRTPTYG